ncbi:hypothetical protein [Nostoc sp.]|uniref:hypothetical protein n=1 Tax=Nostoc sp. TaxID=1180 RepID=UPI002FF7BBA7
MREKSIQNSRIQNSRIVRVVTEQFDRSYPELAVGVASRREGITVPPCRTTSLRDAPRSLSSAGVRGSKLRAASGREE